MCARVGVCVPLASFSARVFCLFDLFDLFVLLRAASFVVRLPSLLLRRLTLSHLCVTVVMTACGGLGSPDAPESRTLSFSEKLRPLQHIQLQVIVQGSVMMVDASPTATTESLVGVVAARASVPLDAFRLYHASRPLRDHARLSELCIRSGSSIEMKMRGRGGGDSGGEVSIDGVGEIGEEVSVLWTVCVERVS